MRNFIAKKSNYLNSLDFEVIKTPIFTTVGDTIITDNKRVAIVNDKDLKILSYMSPEYRLFTNREFTELTEKIGSTFGLSINHYAVHDDGKKVLSVFNKADKTYKIGKYTFDNHIVLYDSRDGSTKLSVGGAGNLHRCSNMFKSTQVQFSVNHSSKLDEMLEQFRYELDTFTENQKQYIQRLEALQDIPVTRDHLYHLLGEWTMLKPSEVKDLATTVYFEDVDVSTRKWNIIKDLNKSYDVETKGGSIYSKKYGNISIEGVGENGFGLLNTITNYYTHTRDKGVTDLFFNDFGTKEKRVIEFVESL